MKKFILVLIVLCLGITSGIFAQDPPIAVTKIDAEEIQPFRAGMWRYSLDQALSGKFGPYKVNGEKSANYREGDIDIGADYFFIDNWGVGANIYRNCTRYKFESGTLDKEADLIFNVNALYGHSFNGFNLLGKASVGFGKGSYKYESNSYSYDGSENLFNWSLSVASPVEIDNNLYITPEVGYQFRSRKEDEWKTRKGGVFLGLNLDMFFDCDDFFCDFKNDFQVPDNRYRQGNIVIGSRTTFNLNTGTCTDTYPGEVGEEEDKYGTFGTHLTGNGYYYVIDNVAVGAGLGFNIYSENEKDTDYKYSHSYFDFMPMVMVNVPVDNALKNLFLDAGVGFGTERWKESYDGNDEYNEKNSRFSYLVGLGYNYFITEKSCLTPFINFSGLNKKEKDTEEEQKWSWSGIGVGVAWNVHLPRE